MAQNAATLDSFVCYYLALGVAPLLLYVDDAADAALRVARRYPPGRVVVRVRDAALRREWRDLPSWALSGAVHGAAPHGLHAAVHGESTGQALLGQTNVLHQHLLSKAHRKMTSEQRDRHADVLGTLAE